jgi:C4-type Zn-finger protein
VKPGARGDGFVETVEGVTRRARRSANFLIDAESHLKAALAGFHGGVSDAGEGGGGQAMIARLIRWSAGNSCWS